MNLRFGKTISKTDSGKGLKVQGGAPVFFRPLVFDQRLRTQVPSEEFELMDQVVGKTGIFVMANGSFFNQEKEEWVNAPDYVIGMVVDDGETCTLNERELTQIKYDLKKQIAIVDNHLKRFEVASE